MSEPSSWPLSDQALRVRVPKHIIEDLELDELSRDLYATAIGYYPDAAQHQMQRISHDDYIMLYCAEGLGHLASDNFSGLIEKGDLFILPPNTAHRYWADERSPWTLFWCHFRGLAARAHFEHIYRKTDKLVIKAHDVHTLAGFRDLVQLARSSYTRASFIHISSMLRLQLTSTERITSLEGKQRAGINIDEIQRYMRQHINRSVSLEELAALSRLSKYHFSRRYQALTGFAPLQHFSHIKIEHACYLLEQSSLSISDIAYQLGYDDALYFSRVFKKLMKLSPSKYRKSLIA